MNVELFVHGVPQGEDFWGKEEDRKYFGTFYGGNGASDKVKFLVQTRLSNGKLYCYYNYLVYENVVANDWRPNSYFGISLRFGAYCKDVLNIYRILDGSFNFHIIGNILNIEKSKLKYAVSGFSNVAGLLKNVEVGILGQLKKVLTSDSVVELNGFPGSSGNVVECNLYECTQDSVLSAMKQYGAVALSPYYTSSKEKRTLQQSQQKIAEVQKNCDNAIKQAKDECTKQLNAINDELRTAKSEIQQQRQTITKKDSEIKSKDEELARLKEENKNRGQYKSLEGIVEQIKKPIHDLAESIQRILPKGSDGRVEAVPPQRLPQRFAKYLEYLKYLNTVLLVLILILLIAQSRPQKEVPKGDDRQEVKEEQTLTEDSTEIQKPKEQAKDAPLSAVDLSKVRIDIEGYNGKGPLEKGKEYKIRAINGMEEGTWEVTGGETVTNTGEDNMIYVRPTEDTVEIIYCVGGSSKNREIEAK